MSSPSNSRVLFISLFSKPWADKRFATIRTRIMNIASLEYAIKPIPTLRAIAEEPKAIFLTDEALAMPRFHMVWEAVIRYIRHGGTAICMGCFNNNLPTDMYRKFFAHAGLQWEYDHTNQCRSTLNADFLPREISDILPSIHCTDAVHLSHVGNSAWYILQHTVKEDIEGSSNGTMTEMANGLESMDLGEERNPKPDEETAWKVLRTSAPVAMAQVGQGYLGFVGDLTPSEEANLIMIAMCGLYM